MATTLASLQKKIEKLQAQAAKLKAQEARGVIERIKLAIQHYELQPADLFAAEPSKPVPGKRARTLPAKPKATRAKPASKIKFKDEQGHTWTGHGKRPRWYVEALESGKTPEDLMLKD
ncbi:H-NS family nucleoid-associated regulatory protein [Variovorax sp. HJSM1_2]|uniref:H-NS histone family protein n=1 Tax=Variovorax sp. HJSM1_2 TaxID=3366263 RepID=UPI003BBE3931